MTQSVEAYSVRIVHYFTARVAQALTTSCTQGHHAGLSIRKAVGNGHRTRTATRNVAPLQNA
jgi:hypothetical protein